MGAFPNTLLLLQLNMEEPTQDIIINGSILKKSSMEEEQKNNKSCRRRRRRTSKSLANKTRRSSTRIVQRVATLRNLVSNMNNDNNNDSDNDNDNDNDGSLEQLFTHTADYISSLQTRVRFMRTLVDVLSGSSSSSSSRI